MGNNNYNLNNTKIDQTKIDQNEADQNRVMSIDFEDELRKIKRIRRKYYLNACLISALITSGAITLGNIFTPSILSTLIDAGEGILYSISGIAFDINGNTTSGGVEVVMGAMPVDYRGQTDPIVEGLNAQPIYNKYISYFEHGDLPEDYIDYMTMLVTEKLRGMHEIITIDSNKSEEQIVNILNSIKINVLNIYYIEHTYTNYDVYAVMSIEIKDEKIEDIWKLDLNSDSAPILSIEYSELDNSKENANTVYSVSADNINIVNNTINKNISLVVSNIIEDFEY